MSTAEPERAPDLLDSPDAGPAAIRGGALRAGGYMLGILLSLASVPFVIRHLGTVDFGRYTVVLSIIALVSGLTEGGVAAVGLREYATRTGAARERLMRNLLGVRLALTVLGVAIALAFTVVAGYDRTIVLGTALASVGLVLQSVQSLVAVPLAGQMRFGWYTLTDLARQVMTVALTIALVVAGAALLPFLAVSIAGGVVALGMTVTLVRGAMPFRPEFHRGEWWLLIRDTLPYSAAIALNVAYFRIAIVIMSLVATAYETGVFAISYRILEVLLPIPALVVGAVFPIVARAARDDAARLAYATGRIFETSVIAGVWLVLCVELSAPFVVEVLAGAGAEDSVPVLRIQGLALLATFVAVGCGYPLLSLRRHRDLLAANGVALVLSVGLTLALVPSLQARGAAIGTTAAEFALAAVTTFLLARARRELRPRLGAALAPLLAAAPVALVALAPGLHEVARVALATVLYFGLLAAMGRIPSEAIDAIPRPRRRRAT